MKMIATRASAKKEARILSCAFPMNNLKMIPNKAGKKSIRMRRAKIVNTRLSKTKMKKILSDQRINVVQKIYLLKDCYLSILTQLIQIQKIM